MLFQILVGVCLVEAVLLVAAILDRRDAIRYGERADTEIAKLKQEVLVCEATIDDLHVTLGRLSEHLDV